MHPELLTVEAAAQILMVGRATAYAWARDGRLPVVRVNGLLRVPRAALMQWIEAQADAPHALKTPIIGEASDRP